MLLAKNEAFPQAEKIHVKTLKSTEARKKLVPAVFESLDHFKHQLEYLLGSIKRMSMEPEGKEIFIVLDHKLDHISTKKTQLIRELYHPIKNIIQYRLIIIKDGSHPDIGWIEI